MFNELKSCSDWKNTEADFRSAFFIRFKSFPFLYNQAIAFSKLSKKEKIAQDIDPKKNFPEPIEQLSPKGLALLSYLYAKKDLNDRQPLIASTIADFKHLVILLDNALFETTVTVLFQATDAKAHIFHKTACLLRKNICGFHILTIDSTKHLSRTLALYILVDKALTQNASSLARPKTILFTAIQKICLKDKTKGVEDSNTYGRQANKYECGTFATKDARQLNRDLAFIESIMGPYPPLSTSSKTPLEAKCSIQDILDNGTDTIDNAKAIVCDPIPTIQYEIPPQYLKGIQSNTYADKMLLLYSDCVVTRKGKTLKETREKHGDAYIQHFSQKYHQWVNDILSQYDASTIKTFVESYDAGKMTARKLEQRYAAAPRPLLLQFSAHQKQGIQKKANQLPLNHCIL